MSETVPPPGPFGWLKHAFAIEPDVPPIPTGGQAKVIDTVCREIIRRGLSFPARMTLETSAPLHYLAGQTLRFVEPFLAAVLDPEQIREFAAFLERKGAVEYICGRLEVLQDEFNGR